MPRFKRAHRWAVSGLSATGLMVASILGAPAAYANSVDQYVMAWGSGDAGQLGDGTGDDAAVPTPAHASGVLAGKTVAQVAAGDNFSCVLAADGSVSCFGQGDIGSLGNGSNDYALTPVGVVLTALGAGEKVARIAAGSLHACAVTNVGRVYCWGNNTYGQLGNNSTVQSNVAVAVDANGVLSGKVVTKIAAGLDHSCALTTDGTVACWGHNSKGQLGDAGGLDSSTPVAIDATAALAGKAVVGIEAGGDLTCAVTSDGLAFCWGSNIQGSLGNGALVEYSPVPVPVNTDGVLHNKQVTSIGVGRFFACAVTSDGSVACWGTNNWGQLGTGSAGVPSSVPVAVIPGAMGSRQVMQVAAGVVHTCVVTTDRAAFCWGSNEFGGLGNPSVELLSATPVAVQAADGPFNAPKPVSDIGVGLFHTIAAYGYSVRPGSPAGLAVTGDSGARVLSWQAPTFAGGSDVAQYWVFYRPAGQTTWKAFARGVTGTQVPLSANATQPGPCTGAGVCPRLHGSLLSGVSYEFQVLAVNSYGNGRWSNMVAATP